MAVFAIDYPTYHSTHTANLPVENVVLEEQQYGAYSTTTSGGVTTYGEGSAISQDDSPKMPSGPRKGFGDLDNPGQKDPSSPIGSVWVLLAFAAAYLLIKNRKNIRSFLAEGE